VINDQKTMTNYRELVKTLQKFNIPVGYPIIVHTSPSFLDKIEGGANTLLGALISVYDSILTPAFTYQTMVIPKEGPENNGLDYDNPPKSSQNAVFFSPDLPTNATLGELAEVMRVHPHAERSRHPILSFTGLHVEDILQSQTLSRPLEPIKILVDQGGWVLLLGVDQTANVSIHHAEQLAGRKQFIRWALTPAGVKECPNFPGCSQGFNVLVPLLRNLIREEIFDSILITATPLQAMIPIAQKLIREDPTTLLCDDGKCARCRAIRREA